MALPNQQTVDYPSFKLVIIGDGGTGKTTSVKRHLTGEFEKKYEREYLCLFVLLCILKVDHCVIIVNLIVGAASTLVLRSTPWISSLTAARPASTAGTLLGRRNLVGSGMVTSFVVTRLM